MTAESGEHVYVSSWIFYKLPTVRALCLKFHTLLLTELLQENLALGRIAEIAESLERKEKFVVVQQFTIDTWLHFEYDMPTASRQSGTCSYLTIPLQVCHFIISTA